MASSAKKKNKHLEDGFPWIFMEPKNCYWWFPMISGLGTENLFSMGTEILRLAKLVSCDKHL